MTSESATASITDLSSTYWKLLELRSKYPGAPLIKIEQDWRERNPPAGPAAQLFKRHLAGVETILDVGAGDRLWESVFERLGIGARYLTSDIDLLHPHDYSDFLGIEDTFDAIVMLELLEHLPLETGLAFLQHAVNILNPGGVLVIGTPNAHHPHHVWSVDLTHVRPWPAHDLWALCVIAGLEGIEVYRQMLTSRKRRPLIPLQIGLARLLELDPAYGLLLFAHKSARSAPA